MYGSQTKPKPLDRREQLALARGEFAELTEALADRRFPDAEQHAKRLRPLGFSVVFLPNKGAR